MSGILIAASTQGYWFDDALVSTLDFALSPSPALAQLKFLTDGTIDNHDNVKQANWIEPPEYGSGIFEIKATANPDTPSSGTMNAWLAISTLPTWGQSQSGIGSTQCDFYIEIRKDGGPVLVQRSLRLIATVDL